MKNQEYESAWLPSGGQDDDPVFGFCPLDIKCQARSVPGTSLSLLEKFFPDDNACLSHVFSVRYGQGFPCGKCGKSTTWYKRSNRKSYLARCCTNSEVNPLKGTVFNHTRVPLKDWFILLLHFTNSKFGFSSTMARRILGVPQGTAYYMCDRIRTHLAILAYRSAIGEAGERVYIDEALFRGMVSKGCINSRTIIFGMCTEEVVLAMAVPNRKAATLIPIIQSCVHPKAIIVTDGYRSYHSITKLGWQHEKVNHSKRIFVNDSGYCQAQIETYWRYLKKCIKLMHLKADERNAWKYINSFNFVYNRRNRSHQTFWDAVSVFPEISSSLSSHISLAGQ